MKRLAAVRSALFLALGLAVFGWAPKVRAQATNEPKPPPKVEAPGQARVEANKPEAKPPLGSQAPALPRTDSPKPDSERKIAATDSLAIAIVGEKDLQTEFRVSASGTIQFPFLDVVEVAGLTPPSLAAKLRELLMKDYFVDPQVLVTVKDYRLDFVTVTGAVNRPGPVPLTGEMKYGIVEVIALAGGKTRLASDTIEYTHKGETRKLSLDKLKSEKNPARKICVEPGDIIDVKEIWI